MSLVESLASIIIGGAFAGLLISVSLSNPTPKELVIYILGLALCVYAVVAGFLKPRKLEIESDRAIVYYLLWKRTIRADEVNSFSAGQDREREKPYFITLKLNNRRKIKFFRSQRKPSLFDHSP